MTLSRFKELWASLITHRVLPKPDLSRPPIKVDGVSPQTEAALIAASDGDHSYWDRIEARVKAHEEMVTRRSPTYRVIS